MLRLIVALLIAPAIVFGACPNGAFEWQTKCYFFKTNGTGFPEAEADCVSNGGHLTSIHDSFSNLLLTERAGDAFGAAKDFWIGLSNIASSKTLAWMDKSKNDFSSWDKGQPSNSSGIKCTSVGTKSGLWKIDNCFQQKPYVCATANTGGPTTTSAGPTMTTTKGQPATTTTTSSGNKCSGNMTYFAGTNACYGNYFNSEDGAKTWNDAESFCQTMGGHLASIHSSDEFNFIMSYDYVSNAYYWPWVGLSTADQGQTWTWTDGTPADYLPWDAGEPTQGYTCTFANSQGFETDDCGDNAGTLCKVVLS